MAVLSKTKKIEALAKLLHKRHKDLPGPAERAVLEHLIYAALLENAVAEQADAAMSILEHHFIDWNEVRVSTIGELADVFSILPKPQAAGERVRSALQGIFEKTYLFDLEDLRRKGKNLSQSIAFLESLSCCSRFMIDYTAQVALGGHVIPLDEAALRVFRLLGLAQVNKEGTREEVPGLERAIAKKNGLAFAVQLHHFAAGFFGDPESDELRTLLKPIDPEALKRSCTPPVLTLPKAAAKPVAKPAAPAPVVLPFISPDEDDFEDDHGGTEAEFLSDDGDAGELPVHRGKDRLPTLPAVLPEVEKGTKKVQKEKKDVKPDSTEKPKSPADKKKSVDEKSKSEVKKTESKKKTEPPPKNAEKKKADPKKPAPKEPTKKAPAKKNVEKPPKKQEGKSPTRQLREKKPK